MSDEEKEDRQARSRAFRFLGIFTGVVVLCLVFSLGISLFNVGRPTGASDGFCRNIESRVSIGQTIQAPKIVLIGGSGVRRGISALRLSNAFSVDVYNFGLQASFGPELILHEARKVLKPGDTAMLVFEYNHYDFSRWNDIALNAIFGCLTDFYDDTSLSQKIEMLMALPPSRTLDVLRYDRGGEFVAADPDDGGQGDPHEKLPEPRAAIQHGDIPLDVHWWTPLSAAQKLRLSLYEPIRIVFDPEARGTREIARFVEWARQNDIKVAMTWPNTIGFAVYDGNPALKAIRDFYEGMGVPVIGAPALGLYPADRFWDTQYHLSASGIEQRTRDLTAALSEYRQILPAPVSQQGQ